MVYRKLPEGHKRCTKCKKVKPLEDFPPRPASKARGRPAGQGKRGTCRVCATQKARIRHLKLTYGITPEEYLQLKAKFNGCCWCCKRPAKSEFSLHVDHIHGTNVIRGLLCYSCNSAIGNLGDSIEGVQNALKYLQLTAHAMA